MLRYFDVTLCPLQVENSVEWEKRARSSQVQNFLSENKSDSISDTVSSVLENSDSTFDIPVVCSSILSVGSQ